jgi:hypothetical protein
MFCLRRNGSSGGGGGWVGDVGKAVGKEGTGLYSTPPELGDFILFEGNRRGIVRAKTGALGRSVVSEAVSTEK